MDTNMPNLFIWIFCFLLVIFIQGTFGNSCRTLYSFPDYSYCEYGCCGDYYSYSDCYEYCCSNTVGITVGCVVAGLFVISMSVVIYFCYKKQRAAAGRVIQPAGYNNAEPTVDMATSYQTSGGYAPYPSLAAPVAPQGNMGTPYNQHPPPAYSSGAAYPGVPMEKGPFQPQY